GNPERPPPSAAPAASWCGKRPVSAESYASSTRISPETYTLSPGSGRSRRNRTIIGPSASPAPIIIELFRVTATAARVASARSGGGSQPRTASATAPARTARPEWPPAHRPQQPGRAQQLDQRAAIPVGDRAPQLVGQVGLLSAERVDRRELPGPHHV